MRGKVRQWNEDLAYSDDPYISCFFNRLLSYVEDHDESFQALCKKAGLSGTVITRAREFFKESIIAPIWIIRPVFSEVFTDEEIDFWEWYSYTKWYGANGVHAMGRDLERIKRMDTVTPRHIPESLCLEVINGELVYNHLKFRSRDKKRRRVLNSYYLEIALRDDLDNGKLHKGEASWEGSV